MGLGFGEGAHEFFAAFVFASARGKKEKERALIMEEGLRWSASIEEGGNVSQVQLVVSIASCPPLWGRRERGGMLSSEEGGKDLVFARYFNRKQERKRGKSVRGRLHRPVGRGRAP